MSQTKLCHAECSTVKHGLNLQQSLLKQAGPMSWDQQWGWQDHTWRGRWQEAPWQEARREAPQPEVHPQRPQRPQVHPSWIEEIQREQGVLPRRSRIPAVTAAVVVIVVAVVMGMLVVVVVGGGGGAGAEYQGTRRMYIAPRVAWSGMVAVSGVLFSLVRHVLFWYS